MALKKKYNSFENGVFSGKEWSAPVLVSPVDLKNRLASFRLEGRKISDIKLIGICYTLTDDYLEAIILNGSADNSVAEEINYDAPVFVGVRIDEPMLIRFEDGDVFEILEESNGEHRVSMNCIPWDIKAGINLPNLDAAKFFKECLGRTVSDVEINTGNTNERDKIWNTVDYDGEKYVTDIILRFDDGNGIRFYGWIDYCQIDYVDCNNCAITKAFKEVAPALLDFDDFLADLVSS